jgi:hypothetical protein
MLTCRKHYMITSFHKEGRFELIQLAYRRHFSFKEALATILTKQIICFGNW